MIVLNPDQQRIVEHGEGPALVIAGAGSGKTRVIIHRVAHLIERGVPPSAIMMVTFTNKSAEEMKRRLEGLLSRKSKDVKVLAGTFHSIANRFLRRYAPLVEFTNNFSILDNADSRDLIKAAIAEGIGKPEKRFPTAGVVQTVLSMGFNRGMELAALLRDQYSWLIEWEAELETIGRTYAKKKRANNAMDFDDLLANWHRLLTENPNVELARRLRYLLVDEYQDTNVIQAEIVELLAGEHRNLMVVGDDAQSIYGWRGANFENILHFPQRMGGEVYRLEENYRSTPNILDLANESINHNEAQFPKNLRAVKPESVHPQITHTYDWREEAELIVERILDYHDQDISFREMGVLYRNHSQSAELQLRLTEQGIPFIVRSGVKFFEQAHIKDIVAFLKVVHNPLDELAWLRILKMLPGIGNTTAQKIYRVFAVQRAVRLTADNLDLTQAVPAKAREEWKKLMTAFHEILGDQITPSMMIERVYEAFYRDVLFNAHDNPWEREADLKFLAEFGAKYRSLDNFLAQLALVGATVIRDHEEEQAAERDTLTLTTIHQAKGLEWEVVFVIGVVEGQFPHRDCLTPQSRLEEERRLFYVSVTRSKQHLQITVPLISYRYGNYEVCSASRFVEELPDHVAEIAKVGEVERLEAGFRAAPSFSIEF